MKRFHAAAYNSRQSYNRLFEDFFSYGTCGKAVLFKRFLFDVGDAKVEQSGSAAGVHQDVAGF